MKTIFTSALTAFVLLSATIYGQATTEKSNLVSQQMQSRSNGFDMATFATSKPKSIDDAKSLNKKRNYLNYNAKIETRALELQGDLLLKEGQSQEATECYIKAIISGLNNIQNFEERRLQYKIRKIMQLEKTTTATACGVDLGK